MPFANGYCYLRAFPAHARREAARYLGPYPALRDVITEMYFHLDDIYAQVPRPIFLVDNYHMDRASIDFYDLFLIHRNNPLPVGSAGYCYAEIVAAATRDTVQTLECVKRWGVFPSLRVVLRHILPLLYPSRTYPLIYKSGPNMYHVSRRMRVSCERFLALMLEVDDFDSPVGLHPEFDINHNSMIVQEALHGLCGSNVKEHAIKQVQSQLMAPYSELNRTLVQSMAQIGDNKLAEGAAKTLHVPYLLDAADEILLDISYKQLKLVFNRKSTHTHPMAAASRYCDMNLMLLNLGYRNDIPVPKGYDSWVKDVGGNSVDHRNRKRDTIHSCNPILDARDSGRELDRNIREIIDSASDPKYKLYLQDPTKASYLRCNNRAEECTHRSVYLMFNHSAYDMSIQQIADAMDIACALKGIIAVHFDPRILLEKSGVMPRIRMHWEVAWDKKKKRRERIEFFFQNDPSINYVHDYDTYVALLTTPFMISSNGKVYCAEVSHTALDTVFITLRLNVYDCPKSTVVYRLWIPETDKKVLIRY